MNEEVEKSVVVGIVLLVVTQILILIGAYLGGLLRHEKMSSCWDNYPTEAQAIEACESHD